MEVSTTLKNSQWILSCKIVGWIGIGIMLCVQFRMISNELFSTIGECMLYAGAAGVIITNDKFENKRLLVIGIASLFAILAVLYYLVYVNPINV
ncbi:hypothetical protein [Membranihabitans marinus]|uniref:hypothetical protein n=1 Tax=Membranihabitans marinus TaxID=1227546 RepID=UPI001F18330C|nr:hypothetical protein [Membranihabitans marinus]